jgi:hypothetical protein
MLTHAAAIALLDHLLRDVLGAEHGAVQVDVDDAPPEVTIELLQRDAVETPRGGSVVDEDVDAPEALDGLSDHSLNVVRLDDVEHSGIGADAQRGALLGDIGRAAPALA